MTDSDEQRVKTYEKFKSNLLKNVDEKIDEFYRQLNNQTACNGIYKSSVEKIDRSVDTDDNSGKVKSEFNLNEKTFVLRNSLLTDLFLSNHIKTIYHFFIAILIVLIINSMLHDIFDEGTLNLKFHLIRWCFGKLPIVITLWMCMFLVVILAVYPSFHYWAHSFYTQGVYDYIWLAAYVIYILSMLVIPIRCIVFYDLPIASSMIVVCEQVRFIMKVHAFVRENVPKAMKFKSTMCHKSDEKSIEFQSAACPSFDKFLYFLFAPTLVYRDKYPRTEKIDWNVVVANFLQVVGCLFYVYYAFSHFCVPIFQDFNKDHTTIRSFIIAAFSSILPGSLCFLLAFYAILHAWHNAFAEMLRFGDRMFYRDWWNSTNFANYYRTWNVIVHDWLYTYVYRDIYLLLGSGSRAGAMISVFWLSAIVHEYIIIIVFRFFYPVLFIEFFFIGVMLLFLTSSHQKPFWNIVFWVGMLVGTGLMMCLYSMEWYARVNCSPTYDTLLDYLVPRSWTCLTSSTDVSKPIDHN